MSFESPNLYDNKQQTLAQLREFLQRNPQLEVISEIVKPNGLYDVLETANFVLAPVFPVRKAAALNRVAEQLTANYNPFLRMVNGGEDFHSEEGEPIGFTFPRITFSETLGRMVTDVKVKTQGVIFDAETLSRYGKRIIDGTHEASKTTREWYSRRVHISLYPDIRLAQLHLDYQKQHKQLPLGTPLPPGSQADLETLREGLTPQLYRSWARGDDLSPFYFAPNGTFIPRFYRIPAERMGQVWNTIKPGEFLPRLLQTEAYTITGGSQVGARLRLWREFMNLTLRDLALRTSGITDTALSEVESGKYDPDDFTLTRIAKSLGIDLSVFNHLQIYPEEITYRRYQGQSSAVVYFGQKREDIKPEKEEKTSEDIESGALLKAKRRLLGLTQVELAALAGISPSAISLMENDKRGKKSQSRLIPKVLDTLKKIEEEKNKRISNHQ